MPIAPSCELGECPEPCKRSFARSFRPQTAGLTQTCKDVTADGLHRVRTLLTRGSSSTALEDQQPVDVGLSRIGPLCLAPFVDPDRPLSHMRRARPLLPAGSTTTTQEDQKNEQ